MKDRLIRKNWIPIVISMSIFLTLLVLAHDFWYINMQCKVAEANFYSASDSSEQATSLASLFEVEGWVVSGECGEKAKTSFYKLLSTDEQMALFNANAVTMSDLITLVQGLYGPNLSMDEVNALLSAKRFVHQKQYTAAMYEYDKVINANDTNLALLYERASILIEVDKEEEALADIEQVVTIAKETSEPTSEQITEQSLALIEQNSELADTLQAAPEETYLNVRQTIASTPAPTMTVIMVTKVDSPTSSPTIVQTPPSSTSSPTLSATTTAPIITPTMTVDTTPTSTLTQTPTDTLTATPTDTLTATPTDTLTVTPTGTLTVTPTDTLTVTPTDTLTVTPTNVLSPIPTNTSLPSNTPFVEPSTAQPTNISQPTRTPRPSNTPFVRTSTPIVLTNTPLPPNSTPVPPSSTPVPPSSTPVPPSSTPVPPSSTPVPPSSTPVPPSSTPVPTNTPFVPTNTPFVPTNTPFVPTNTPFVPTNTPFVPTNTPIPPTNIPAAYARPMLLAPENNVSISNNTLLQWSWNGTLQENEFFDVRVWREGDPAYGIGWTKDTSFLFYPGSKGDGSYLWSVVVIRGQNGQWQADLSDSALPRSLNISGAVAAPATSTPKP